MIILLLFILFLLIFILFELMLLGIRYEFVHMEMIVRSLIRKKTNILEYLQQNIVQKKEI